jgi:hypothetical protein
MFGYSKDTHPTFVEFMAKVILGVFQAALQQHIGFLTE